MDRYFHHYHKTFKVRSHHPPPIHRVQPPMLPASGAQNETRRQTKVIIQLEDAAQGLRELHQMSTWGVGGTVSNSHQSG